MKTRNQTPVFLMHIYIPSCLCTISTISQMIPVEHINHWIKVIQSTVRSVLGSRQEIYFTETRRKKKGEVQIHKGCSLELGRYLIFSLK